MDGIGKGCGKIGMALHSLALAASLSACSSLPGVSGGATWQEEVVLHDGRTVVVERTQSLGGKPTIDSRERIIVDELWAIPFPGATKQLGWRTDYRQPPEGSSLMLLLIGFVDEVPYLAASPAGCLAYNHWGRPNPPYVFFKFVREDWQRIGIEAFPAQLSEANVVVGRPDPENRSGLVRAATIRGENRLLEPYHRQIIREAISGGPVGGCPDYRSPRYMSPKAPEPIPPQSGNTHNK